MYSIDLYEISAIFFILVIGISVFLITRKTIQLFLINSTVNRIIQNSIPENFSIRNASLNNNLKLFRIPILISTEIDIPMATHLNKIIMPSDTAFLCEEEYESIIAHELEHIYWKDPQIKLLLSLLKSIFWWIPMRNWLKKVYEDQEMSCDQRVLRHHFSEEILASAIVKVTAQMKGKKSSKICYLTDKKNLIHKRIKAHLNRYPKEKMTFFGALIVFLGLIIAAICLANASFG